MNEPPVTSVDPATDVTLPGRVPDAVLGAAIEVVDDLRLRIPVDDRLQPRATMTLTVWLCWGRTTIPPTVAAPAADAPAVVALILGRPPAGGTLVRVATGTEQPASTVDLDTASGPEPGAGRQLDPGPWHHVALLWDGPGRVVRLLVDGVALPDHPIALDHLPFRRDAHLVIGTDPAAGRALLVGPLRLHRRLRTAAELTAERRTDLGTRPGVDELAPLALRLSDDVDEPTLTITDDDAPGRALAVVLENRSSFPVALPVTGAAGSELLELRFRPGCLADEAHDWTEPGPPGWRVESTIDGDGTVSLFLGRQEEHVLAPGTAAAVRLDHIRAAGDLGAHGTHVELHYPHPHHTDLRCVRVAVARVVGQRGRRRSPLRLAVVGDGVVINDSGTANDITLRLVNTSPVHAVTLHAPAPKAPATALVLSFVAATDDVDVETGQGGVADRWALATVDQLLGAKLAVHPSTWAIDVVTLDEAPEWILVPTRDQVLGPGGYLDLVVSDLHTAAPDGPTTATVRAENVAGYWDTEYTAELTKAAHAGELPPGAMVLWAAGTDAPAGWVSAGAAPFTGPGGIQLELLTKAPRTEVIPS